MYIQIQNNKKNNNKIIKIGNTENKNIKKNIYRKD